MMVKNKEMIKEADALNPKPLMLSDEGSGLENKYLYCSKKRSTNGTNDKNIWYISYKSF